MFVDLQIGNLVEPLTGRRWEPHEILSRTRGRVAWYQGASLRRGDRVFLHFGNRLEVFVDLLAIWTLGGCAVPVDSRLTSFEISRLAAVAKPRLSVWDQAPTDDTLAVLTDAGTGVAEIADAGAAGAPGGDSDLRLDDDALILFTSGTTGDPKAVVHTHRSLRARWTSLRQALGTHSYRRTLNLLPTHFGHGLICNCLFPWLSGQDLHLLPPFRADVVLHLGKVLDEHRITFLSSVPPVWRLALKTAKPPQMGTLERVFCGSAPLSASLRESIRAWTGTDNVFNAYGITETGSWLAGSLDASLPSEDGFIGSPWGGVIRILEEGTTDRPPWEIRRCAEDEPGYVWVNTPALMRGYLDREDLTRKSIRYGWFITGDIGVMNGRGHLYLLGREREEINKGGTKIYPPDIDSVAERFEEVTDVCSFGCADPLHGENVAIALVMQRSDDAALVALHDWMSSHLAQHKLPERWYLVDEISRTSRGKINRAEVAAACEQVQPINMRRLLGKR